MNHARIAKSASLLTVFLFLGAGGARAADDGTVFGALSGFFGYNQNQSGEKIDFRERPKIVVPPSRQALPEPRAADSTRSAAWPVDKGSSQRGGPRVAGSGQNADPSDPKRENLTQPPDGYRHATKDVSNLKDPDAKPGLLSSLGGFGSGLSGLTKNIGFGD